MRKTGILTTETLIENSRVPFAISQQLSKFAALLSKKRIAMPNYDYRCNDCGHEFEVFQSMSAPKLKKCPQKACGGKVERLLGTGAGLIFKGSGFYETDYRSESYKAGEKKAKESQSKTDNSKSESKSEKKKKTSKAKASKD